MTDITTDAATEEVIAVRTVDEQPDDFMRAIQNTLEFRNLQGGTYALVRVTEESEDD